MSGSASEWRISHDDLVSVIIAFHIYIQLRHKLLIHSKLKEYSSAPGWVRSSEISAPFASMKS